MRRRKMSEVFKSRWGYHPCSKEVDKKLRKLNGMYQKALSSAAAWERWNRKAPHNRILRKKIRDEQGRVCGRVAVLDDQGNSVELPEPKLCPVFCKKMVRKAFDWVKLEYYDRECVEVVDHGIPAAARNARTPRLREEDVKPLGLTLEQIDKFLS